MQLRPLASVTVNLKPPVMVGPGPFTGKVLPGGGDWALLGADHLESG